jgi:glucokinase-like ROK family protein
VGKPAILLRVVDDARQLIGMDLANSEFRGAVVNLRGEIQHFVSLPVDERHQEAALALVYELLDELVPAATAPLLGIGIGTPGLMDSANGIVRNAVNLEWENLPLRDLLQQKYDLPTSIANDCHLAALAEYTFGEHEDLSNLVVVKVGRGIGCGIVLKGRLHYGDGAGAGEIGHVVVVKDGALCSCGNYGCLETVASSRAIVQQARRIARDNPGSILAQLAGTGEINTDVVLQAFEAGDDKVQGLVHKAGLYLGQAIANLVGILNVRHILIAGSAARFGEALLRPIRDIVPSSSLPLLASETNIEIASLGQDIVILGASALLLSSELGLV